MRPIETLSRRARPRSTSATRLKACDAFGANPGHLRMFAYAPAKLEAGAPLIVFLHGCGQSAASYDKGAGWTALADELGFAVLAPEQDSANNMNGCFNWFQAGDTARDHGEAASIAAMIAWMIAHHRLDRARVFITGLSAGGAMAAAMLAAYPEVFAGGAIIAGVPVGAAANVPEALNAMRHAPARSPQQWGDKVRGASSHHGARPAISIWHGDADSVVHVSNAEAAIAQWANVLGVEPSAAEIEQMGRHRRSLWRAPGGAVVLESFQLSGMGHGAPVGGQGYGAPGAFFPEAGISSTARIAAFWGFPVKTAKQKNETWIAPRLDWKALPKNLGGTIAGALKAAGLLKA